MRVTPGYRTHVGAFVARWSLPLAVVAFVGAVPLVVFYNAPLGRVITLVGLFLDGLGAITLAGGLLALGAARIRADQPMLAEPLRNRTRWQKCCSALPLAWAKKFGSPRSIDASSTPVEGVVDTFWGLAMLLAGFFAQAVGVVLPLLGLR